MPRKARILVPNCPHHLVQRGHNRKAVFLEARDYRYYLDNLKEWKPKLEIKIYAWCLMTNHIHLIAEPGSDAMTIAQLMKRVNGRQSAYVNKFEGRTGSLWEGRYKGSPIQQENYFLRCCRYVELNPVVAGMVRHPQASPWSSYTDRISGAGSGLLDEHECYRRLGRSSVERTSEYVAFLSENIPTKESKFISDAVTRNQLTGNERFVDEIEHRIELRVLNRGRGRPVRNRK